MLPDKKDVPEFFKTDNQDELDSRLSTHMSRPTLVGKMKESRRRKQAEDKRKIGTFDFSKDLRRYWWLYLFLGVSALFTGTLGIYMGIAPYKGVALDGTPVIIYNTDIPHILLATVYFVAFITVTEIAVAIFKWLYHTREDNNSSQKTAATAGMVISFMSVMITGIAGGAVIASQISFLTNFIEVPEKVQTWVVVAIPLLITIYSILGTVYALSSEQAQAERMTNEAQRERDLDHQTRMTGIAQIGREKIQYALIQKFETLVLTGKISMGEAEMALEKGFNVAQLEEELGRDVDGDNVVGTVKKG